MTLWALGIYFVFVLLLVTAMLANSHAQDEAQLRWALELVARVHHMAEENLVSRQYQIAAACQAASA